MSRIIAIPSSQPGGLDAPLGAHFGHCDLYTLVTVEDEDIKEVKIIPNVPHQQGGCMAPVKYLAQQGVVELIAGGMGMRPLMGFNQAGIEVFLVPIPGQWVKPWTLLSRAACSVLVRSTPAVGVRLGNPCRIDANREVLTW